MENPKDQLYGLREKWLLVDSFDRIKASDMATKMELLSLHKYFLNASLMKQGFDDYLRLLNGKGTADDIPELWARLSLWYGCLRVVIEGWKTLELNDGDVDPLLIEEKIQLLNGFRNDTFHFKHDYISARTEKVLNDSDFTHWVRLLHDPLGSSILKQLKAASS